AMQDVSKTAAAQLAAREQELTAELDRVVAEHAEGVRQLEATRANELSEKEAAWTAKRRELESEVRNLSLELEQTHEKRENLESELKAKTVELAQTRDQLDASEGQARGLETSLQARTGERDSARADAARLSKELDATRAELAKTQEHGRDLEEEVR